MTIRVDGAQETLFYNGNYALPIDASLEIQSQWSRERETFTATKVINNDRYSAFVVDFGSDFKNEHKNGIYWARLTAPGISEGAWFLLKIITQPGGNDGMTRYTSNPDTEERVADTYYRPNY